MRLSKPIKIAAALALLAAAAVGGLRVLRGPVGATTEYGGTLESRVLPEFTSTEVARWVNGAPAPLANLRGEVVFIEAWGPA